MIRTDHERGTVTAANRWNGSYITCDTCREVFPDDEDGGNRKWVAHVEFWRLDRAKQEWEEATV